MTAAPTDRLIGAGRAFGRRMSPRWHSRRVHYLKLVLPLLALIITTAVLAWPQLAPEERRFRLNSGAKISAADASSLTMLSPRYVGVDDKERPFVLTAVSATQQSPKSKMIVMSEPKADMTVESGAWLAATAIEGVYRQQDRTLDLQGKVSVYHDSGFELHTEEATIDFKASEAMGVKPVETQGPSGHITANKGFRVYDRGDRIEYVGKSKVILRQGALSNS